jgi:acyl carrier protein
MTRDEVKQALIEVLKDRGFDVSDVSEEASLTDDLGLDSLDLVDLTMDIEEKFGLSIPDEDLPKLSTVGAVIDYIVSNRG